jgi:hypothetical protein
MIRAQSRFFFAATLTILSLGACTGSEPSSTGAAGSGPTGTAGSGAAGTGAAGTTGAAGSGAAGTGAAGSGAAGTGAAGTGAAGTGAAGTGVAGTGAAGTGAAGTTGAAGAGVAGTGAAGTGAAGSGAAGTGAAGTGAAGAGPNKTPMCITENVADGENRAKNNYIECDVEDQAIDWDVAANYGTRKPGYDPGVTPTSFTDYGTAFTGHAVQLCHPYCYKGNLTIGVELNGATPAGLKGEVLFDFPQTGLQVPIANAVGRNSLGWIFLDGPALPAGATIQAQMVLKTKAKGVIVANNGMLNLKLKQWAEFKYFPIQQGFAQADLVDVTSIGFRITVTGTTGTWSGVIYADHFQLRK